MKPETNIYFCLALEKTWICILRQQAALNFWTNSFDDIVCPVLSGGRYRNRQDKAELAMTFDLYSIQSC